jgi:hypothetical protein
MHPGILLLLAEVSEFDQENRRQSEIVVEIHAKSVIVNMPGNSFH